MNYTFILTLVLIFMAAWALVSYFLVRINRQNRIDKQAKSIQPAFRLADQWIMESQRKIERLIESVEHPLGTAQSELLELRMEASRLPQGVKNLQNVREALGNRVNPRILEKTLAEIAALYLTPVEFRIEDSDFIYLETQTGSMPVLEARWAKELTDEIMKAYLQRLSIKANSDMGGFLYFAKPEHFLACQGNKEWMDALRNYRLVAVDFEGLIALLISLKLSHETDQLIQVFQAGVQSTFPLVGQSDKMGLALTGLSASVLNAQTVLDGGVTKHAVEVKE